MSDRLDLQSPDLVNQNLEKIAALFPNCVTEGPDGKVVDFDLLKQELNHDVIEGAKERYRLEWPGKRQAMVTANLPTNNTLRPVREESEKFDNTENLYIVGDNLEVLKIMQESYLGKIKMIYIDPPYNTGQDFVYRDNFKLSQEEYEERSGEIDKNKNRLFPNPETSGRYHSDWLNMMLPRLKLAKNLLSDDGVIFISIGEDEFANLEKLLTEIFGSNGKIGELIWKRRQNVDSRAKSGLSTDHEYCLIYRRTESGRIRGGAKDMSKYSNPDNDPRGPWMSDNMTGLATIDQRPNLHYPIVHPTTGQKYNCGETGWRYGKETMAKLIADGEVLFPKKPTGRPRRKKFMRDLQSDFTGFSSVLQTVFNTQGTRELRDLFNGKDFFDFPKPVDLMMKYLEQGNSKGGIVLDFFSGSGSTAEAVMRLNARDGGKMRFCAVQLPEKVNDDSDAQKAGYQTLADIGLDRIRRAAAKIKEETNADIDYGFRVYKLDSSNMEDVYHNPQSYDQGQLDLLADNVKPDRTAEDLLTQVILAWGLPLSLKIEEEKVAGKQVFKVAGNSLHACFDSGIDEAFAKEIAKEEPLRVVFKDSAFASDTAKVNVQQLLKQLSPNTEMKVI